MITTIEVKRAAEILLQDHAGICDSLAAHLKDMADRASTNDKKLMRLNDDSEDIYTFHVTEDTLANVLSDYGLEPNGSHMSDMIVSLNEEVLESIFYNGLLEMSSDLPA